MPLGSHLPADGKPLDVSAHQGEIWSGRFTIPPNNYSCLGFEHIPVILCPDRETARQINASLVQTADGHYFPHQFQVRIYSWLEQQKTADLTVPIVDLRQLTEQFAAEPNYQALLGQWGIFTYINHVLENQDIDPASEQFGANANTTLLAIVNSLDKPFNPYFGKLEKRLLIPALRHLLKLQENDSFKETSSNYNGVWAMNYLSTAQQLAEGYHQIRDQEALALWRDGVRRVADRFSMFRVSCENQSAHWPLAYYYLYQGIGEPGYQQLAKDFIAGLCLPERNPFMQTGYQQEAYGPDASYQGLSTCIQAAYYRLSHDTIARDGLQRIFNLFNHTIVPEPDGSKVGATNFSHRTKCLTHAQYGAGSRFCKESAEAACLAGATGEARPGRTAGAARLYLPPAIASPRRPNILQCVPIQPATPPGQTACRPKTTHPQLNNEFFWRRPGFYALAYIGKTAHARTRREPQNPENPPRQR